jgi:hypothetical protein
MKFAFTNKLRARPAIAISARGTSVMNVRLRRTTARATTAPTAALSP